MGITVGSQQAGIINNVEGTQYVGPQYGQVVGLPEARQAVGELSRAVAGIPMPEEARAAAQEHIRGMDTELAGDAPDRSTVKRHLTGLADVLRSVGAVAGAATTALGPLQTLAAWLGHTVGPLLQLLPL